MTKTNNGRGRETAQFGQNGQNGQNGAIKISPGSRYQQDGNSAMTLFNGGHTHAVDTTTLVIHTPNTSLSFLPHTPHSAPQKLTLNTTFSPPNTHQMVKSPAATPPSPAVTPSKLSSPGETALNKTYPAPKSPGKILGLLTPSQAPAGSIAREILTDLAVHDVAVIKQYLIEAECKLAMLETDNFGLRKRVREMENEAVQHTAQARLMQAKLVCVYVCMYMYI
jgi:hypothetical protein